MDAVSEPTEGNVPERGMFPVWEEATTQMYSPFASQSPAVPSSCVVARLPRELRTVPGRLHGQRLHRKDDERILADFRGKTVPSPGAVGCGSESSAG